MSTPVLNPLHQYHFNDMKSGVLGVPRGTPRARKWNESWVCVCLRSMLQTCQVAVISLTPLSLPSHLVTFTQSNVAARNRGAFKYVCVSNKTSGCDSWKCESSHPWFAPLSHFHERSGRLVIVLAVVLVELWSNFSHCALGTPGTPAQSWGDPISQGIHVTAASCIFIYYRRYRSRAPAKRQRRTPSLLQTDRQ